MVRGYVPSGKTFDSMIVGYYEDDNLAYVARVRNGFTPAVRVTRKDKRGCTTICINRLRFRRFYQRNAPKRSGLTTPSRADSVTSSGRGRTAQADYRKQLGADPAAGDEEPAANDGGGSPVPERSDF